MTTEEDDFGKIYTAGQAEQLRAVMIDTIVKPFLQRRFDEFPALQSAALLVAQYWNDEANDAVHGELVFSVLETPVLGVPEPDAINLPGLPSQWQIFSGANRDFLRWDSNCMAIPAFAAFCKEDCHQEMEPREAYTLFATFHRQADRIATKYVGVMLRPWLNGVRPEWFDEMSEAEAEAAKARWLDGKEEFGK